MCVCGPVQDSEFWRVVMLCISFVFIHCTPKSIHSRGFEMLENGWKSREARTGSGSGGNPNEFFFRPSSLKSALEIQLFSLQLCMFSIEDFFFVLFWVNAEDLLRWMSFNHVECQSNLWKIVLWCFFFFSFARFEMSKYRLGVPNSSIIETGPCRSFVVSAYFPAIFGISLFVFVSFLRRYSLF